MGTFIDLTGQRFGAWLVINRAANVGTVTRWVCQCNCGTKRPVNAGHLRNGSSTCCGCLKPIKSHGEARGGSFTKKYRTWRQIKARCCNPKHKNANIYYGLLCQRWLCYSTFAKEVPEPLDNSLTIDRIDNAKGYEPGNVRWVTLAEQHRNQTNCRWIEHNGRRMLLTDWAKYVGITDAALHERLKKWTLEKALSR